MIAFPNTRPDFINKGCKGFVSITARNFNESYFIIGLNSACIIKGGLTMDYINVLAPEGLGKDELKRRPINTKGFLFNSELSIRSPIFFTYFSIAGSFESMATAVAFQ
jgi:hypothetical protein